MTIELRVRPITRYIVTRFERSERTGSSTQVGTYDNAQTAYEVAYALARAESERLGLPPGDMGVIYPEHPDTLNARPAGSVPATDIPPGESVAAPLTPPPATSLV